MYKSFCAGEKHQSATKTMEGASTKTDHELLVGKCVQCNRKKSMIVSDNAAAPEYLNEFFKNSRRSSAKAGKN